MIDITLIKGKLITWEKGDVFIVESEDGNKLNFWFPPEVSPERTALLDSMMHCTDVEVVVRVKE